MDPSQRPPPEYGISHDGAVEIILFTVFCLFLGTLAIGLRFWSRHLRRIPLTWNDWAVLPAQAALIAIGAIAINAAQYDGLGTHVWLLPDPMRQVTNELKDLLAYNILWAVCNMLVRFSILHLYITIFATRKYQIAAKVMMVINGLFMVGVILAVFLYCIPFEANWNSHIPGARCGDLHQMAISQGTINLLIDVAVLSIPLPALWGLQLPLRKKLALVGIFGIGFAICGITIVRIVSLATFQPSDNADIGVIMVHVGWWSMLENALGVINCCLPVLQPVLNKLLGRSSLTTRGSGSASRTAGTAASYSKGGGRYSRHSPSANHSIQVEHKVMVSSSGNDTDDGIPLQSRYYPEYGYAESRSPPNWQHTYSPPSQYPKQASPRRY